MDFVHVWLSGITNPRRAVEQLRGQPAPHCGLRYMLMRWAGTVLTTGLLALALKRGAPQQSYLTFLPTEAYRVAGLFISPAFGCGIWLLMSALVHLIFRLGGEESDLDPILNIVGWGMLVVMPVVWLWDWAMLALNSFRVATLAPVHSVVQVWETALEALGFHRILGVKASLAVVAAVIANIIFVLLAMVFIR